MNAGWNQVSTVNQQQFLRQTGLSELPAPSAMTSAQLTALTGIVGETAVESLQQAETSGTADTGSTIAEPQLPRPDSTKGDWSALMLAIAKLQMRTSELQTDASIEGVMATKDEMALSNEKQLDKLNESIENMEKSNSLGTASKVLSWIGIGITMAAAVVLTVCSGGAGVPLLIAATLGLTSMVLTETGAMDTIVEGLADTLQSWGMESDTAKMVSQIIISAALILASVAAAWCSCGMASGSSFATIAGVVSGFAGAATSVASGGVGIAKSVVNYDVSQTQADAEELNAWLTKLQAILSEQTEMLEQVMQMLTGNISDTSDILSTIANSNKSIISNMGV